MERIAPLGDAWADDNVGLLVGNPSGPVSRVLLAIAVLVAMVVAGLALHVATATGDTVFSWKRPDNLGVKDGIELIASV